jgi:UDP-N-acetyl-D-glucosamine dehydrogenase
VDRAAELLNTQAKPLNGAQVLLLGVTYKKDVPTSASPPRCRSPNKLMQHGAALSDHDPFVERWAVHGCDIPRAASPTDPAGAGDPAPGAYPVRRGGHRREGAAAVRHP